MFAYCNNNPVIHKDSSGFALDTVFDIISLGFSIAEVAANPADLWAWASLSGDLVDVLLPCVGGLGEMIDGMRAAGYADEVAEAVSTIATTGSAAQKGKRGELLVGIFSNSGKTEIHVGGRTRIPDLLTNDTLIEVKNVAYLSNTQQLRDFAQYAGDDILKILYIRPNTKCSQSLLDAGWDIRKLW